MEIQYESKEDVVVELEKLCVEWNIYPKRVDRVRPKPLTNNSKSIL
jgi:hypothetical protein